VCQITTCIHHMFLHWIQFYYNRYNNVYTLNSAAPPSPPTRRGHSRSGSTNHHHNVHGHTRSHSNNSNNVNTTGTPTNNNTDNSNSKKVDKLELIIFVSDLLSYIGVLFSRHNTMVLDGFVHLVLHSTHRAKGRYRMSRSCPSTTATSDNATTSTTSSDSTNTDSPCTSESTEDKTGPSFLDSNPTTNKEAQSDSNQHHESITKFEHSDRCLTPANEDSGGQTNQQTTEATDIDSTSDEAPVPAIGEFMVEFPYLSMVVLHSVSNLLSGINWL
jgi:hypothetical protein